MRKTSVYLTQEEAADLRRLAVRDGKPQAELIREGIRRVIEESEQQSRDFRSLGKGRGGGRPFERWESQKLYDKATGGS